jgi:hypothetical protein
MFVASNVTHAGLTRSQFRLYTVNDFSRLCVGSQMITLWGADISPGIGFPAAKAGRFGFVLAPRDTTQDDDSTDRQGHH